MINIVTTAAAFALVAYTVVFVGPTNEPVEVTKASFRSMGAEDVVAYKAFFVVTRNASVKVQ